MPHITDKNNISTNAIEPRRINECMLVCKSEQKCRFSSVIIGRKKNKRADIKKVWLKEKNQKKYSLKKKQG